MIHEPIQVLTIDDDPGFCELLKGSLERSPDIKVDFVLSTIAASSAITEKRYDAIICDYQMPDGDGIALLKRLRADNDLTPFIIFTGKGREEVVIEALNSGVDIYLQKGTDDPSQFIELENKLRMAVSKRRRELELKESEDRFHSLVDVILDPVLIIGFDARVYYANEAMFKLLEIAPRKDFGDFNILTFMRSESHARAISNLEKIQQTGGPMVSEYELVTSSGIGKTVETASRMIIWEGVKADLVSFRDVTGHRRTEKLLSTHLMISEYSHDHTLDELLQKTLDEAEALTDSNIGFLHFVDDDQESLQLQMWSTNTIKRMCTAEGKGQHYPISKAGVWVDCVYLKEPVVHNDVASLPHRKGFPPGHTPVKRELVVPVIRKGKVKSILGVGNKETDYTQEDVKTVRELADLVWDITERKRAEEALRDSEIRYRTLLDQAADAVFMHDEKGRIIDVNKKACQSLGYTREELLSMSIADVDPDAIKAEKDKLWGPILAGENVTFESHHIRKDGSVIPIEVTLGSVHLPFGKFILGIVRDITERKRVEEALRQTNTKLNLLSSVTRHDINNQLMLLVGNLTLLDKKCLDRSTDEYLQRAEAAAERISAMIQFTKEYENIGVNAPMWQDVRKLVTTASETVPLDKVSVVNDVPEGTEVFADPLITKVFHNLMDNAMRHGGKITKIRFSFEEVEDARAIICEDDGEGISADMKEKLFTRGHGKDHGLGLFLAREILSITGITIVEKGEPGHGARFVMTIPQNDLRETKRDDA